MGSIFSVPKSLAEYTWEIARLGILASLAPCQSVLADHSPLMQDSSEWQTVLNSSDRSASNVIDAYVKAYKCLQWKKLRPRNRHDDFRFSDQCVRISQSWQVDVLFCCQHVAPLTCLYLLYCFSQIITGDWINTVVRITYSRSWKTFTRSLFFCLLKENQSWWLFVTPKQLEKDFRRYNLAKRGSKFPISFVSQICEVLEKFKSKCRIPAFYS